MDISFFSQEDMHAIKSSFLFKNIDDNFLLGALSAADCEAVEYEKGSVIYDETDFRRSIGLVLSGKIQVSKNLSGGRRFIMNTILPSGLFGAAAIFSGNEEYYTHIEAVKKTRIVFFTRQLLEKLIYENSHVAVNYIMFLSGRIEFLNKKIQSLITVSTGQALARFLVSSAESTGMNTVLTPGYSALAQMLNMGRASLYRCLDSFENAGLIKRDGKTIVISDLQGLMSISSGVQAE